MLRTASDEVVIFVTVPNEAEGASIARAIISEKLAACVNMVPAVRSFYWWENQVQDDAELLLIIKSRRVALNALNTKIQELHSYDLPEFITVPIEEGSKDYLNWLQDSVPSPS